MSSITLLNSFLMAVLLAGGARAASFVFRRHRQSPAFVAGSTSWVRPITSSPITTFDSQSTNKDDSQNTSSPYIDFAMEPDSEEARLITSKLGLSEQQHETLQDLVSLVVQWNEKINLISRKDCTGSVVFGRHVLPSIALSSLPFLSEEQKIVDVGTGGGFPGLPLAICFPESHFLLVDSVGKKINTVKAMAEELGLENVKTHHGRAEELVDDVFEGREHQGAYDVCVGRSVAALPKFCFWINDLLKKQSKEGEDGKLIYIVGGDIEDDVLSETLLDVGIDDLLDEDDASDKRVLVLDQSSVAALAATSGEKKQKRGRAKPRSNPRRSQRTSKGAWERKGNAGEKQRGYDNFKRYDG